jgi:hypothetical protein
MRLTARQGKWGIGARSIGHGFQPMQKRDGWQGCLSGTQAGFRQPESQQCIIQIAANALFVAQQPADPQHGGCQQQQP